MENEEKDQLCLEFENKGQVGSLELDDKEEAGSSFSDYIVYVDESGDHSLTSIDKSYPIFVLAFCVFHKKHYSEKIVSVLEKFKFKYFGHDQIILHEKDIRKESPPFNIFKSKVEREQFMDELSQIVDESNFILISCIIDKVSLSKQESTINNPYHIALRLCIDKLYDFLIEKRQEPKKVHVVFECRGRKEDAELELEFRRICGGNNKRGEQLSLDAIFSDKKAMSSGLQLADLVARPVGLSFLKPNQNNRAFNVLKEKFYCKGGRKNVGKDYEGLGLMIYPSPESEKPR